MKIATMATGGIGGYLAVKLALAGHEVVCIARGAHLAAIRKNGLRLDAPDGSLTARPWMATDTPAEVGPVDAILFGVKGDGLVAAAEACRPMLGPDTVVVPFLNGVEAATRLCAVLPEAHVADGVAQISTTISEPGVITQTGAFARFLFAERDSRPSARIDALRAAINAAGAVAPEVPDIVAESWFKFVLFSAFSGVTAAARCTVGDILAHEALGETYRAAVAETAAIGRARGVAIPDDIETVIWGRVQGMPPMMRASTAIDIEHGRPLEIDWVSGAAVRLGRESGVPVPVNTALYAVLLPHKNGR